MLNKNGVASEVAVDDWRAAGMQITGKRNITILSARYANRYLSMFVTKPCEFTGRSSTSLSRGSLFLFQKKSQLCGFGRFYKKRVSDKCKKF